MRLLSAERKFIGTYMGRDSLWGKKITRTRSYRSMLARRSKTRDRRLEMNSICFRCHDSDKWFMDFYRYLQPPFEVILQVVRESSLRDKIFIFAGLRHSLTGSYPILKKWTLDEFKNDEIELNLLFIWLIQSWRLANFKRPSKAKEVVAELKILIEK